MIRDRARIWTDNRLEEMERHLKRVYKQTYSEISEKWNEYMERGQERLDSLYAAYLSAPAEQKAAALQRYQDALESYTLRNRWYSDMVTETAYRLANTNSIALAYVNGQIPAIYSANFNYIDPELRDIGIKWTIRDEYTVRRLMMDTLPYKTVNYAKDMAWNARTINSSVLQGILQGEGIPKIAKRLLPVVNNNRNAAIRTARTMVTGAENRGRQDRYKEYEAQGVEMAKVWIATPDGRTRNWHMSMDGQEVGVDEPFIDGLGNELEYPGDPGAPPNTVYNCRCTMRSHILAVRGHRIGGEFGTDLHRRQIAEERARREG